MSDGLAVVAAFLATWLPTESLGPSLARNSRSGSIGDNFGGNEWQQSHFSRSADRGCDHSLLLGSITGLLAGENLSSLIDETTKDVHFLVVDEVDLVDR